MAIEQDIYSDPLFVGMTRPATRYRVPVKALVLEVVFIALVIMLTHNVLFLLAAIPIHGILMLITADNPWIFDELLIWFNTKSFFGCMNRSFWGAASFSPLPMKKWQK